MGFSALDVFRTTYRDAVAAAIVAEPPVPHYDRIELIRMLPHACPDS
jgi:hypothetical protein